MAISGNPARKSVQGGRRGDLLLRARGIRWWSLAGAFAVTACSEPGQRSDELGLDSQAIINGAPTSNEVWPWSVRISNNGVLKCGGALVAPEWVLTAAHCITLDPAGYAFQLGDGRTVGASYFVRHPQYVDDMAVTGHFDMGLARLSQPAVAGANVDFVRPAVGGDQPGTMATAIGWGMTNHDTTKIKLPPYLMEVDLPVVQSSACNNVLPVRHTIYPDELCAGFADGAAGVCFGDSGSPLVVQRSSGKWEHIGTPSGVTINANGMGCESFAVFARTSAMVGWVRHYVLDPAWFAFL